jgi:hypothetical protein
MLKLIIAGGRDLQVTNEQIKDYCVRFNLVPDEIVSGGARGIDSCAQRYVSESNIPFTLFEANWAKLGNYAGPLRNLKMALHGDALLLIWDGQSKGSANMKSRMLGLKKPIHEIVIGSENA